MRCVILILCQAYKLTRSSLSYTQFCSTYPAEIVVPAKISDTTLSYAVKYRSKGRIPGLVYLHWANLVSSRYNRFLIQILTRVLY